MTGPTVAKARAKGRGGRKAKPRTNATGQALMKWAAEVKEAPVLTAIRHTLSLCGGVRVFRNSVGFDQTTCVQYGLGRGSADLVAIVAPHGRWLCLEVKRPQGGVVSDAQKAWLADMARCGAVIGVVTSVEEAMKKLDEARRAKA